MGNEKSEDEIGRSVTDKLVGVAEMVRKATQDDSGKSPSSAVDEAMRNAQRQIEGAIAATDEAVRNALRGVGK